MLYARLLGVLRSSAVARQHPDDTSNSPQCAVRSLTWTGNLLGCGSWHGSANSSWQCSVGIQTPLTTAMVAC